MRCGSSAIAARSQRDLSALKLVYLWADGVYVKAGLEDSKAALLVLIGADAAGTTHALAVTSGARESTPSWPAVLRDSESARPERAEAHDR